MIKGKIISFSAVLILLMTVFIYSQMTGVKNEVGPQISQEQQKEIEAYLVYLQEEGGFFDQVGEELKKFGYTNFSTTGTFYSKEDIRIQVLLPESEEVNEEKNNEVNQIYQEIIRKFGLDPNAFTVEVSHPQK